MLDSNEVFWHAKKRGKRGKRGKLRILKIFSWTRCVADGAHADADFKMLTHYIVDADYFPTSTEEHLKFGIRYLPWLLYRATLSGSRVKSIMFLNLAHVPMNPRARTSVLDLWSLDIKILKRKWI